MKYSVTVKFIAIILCACSLVAVAFSGLGIVFMEGYDLYKTPLETVQQREIDAIGNQVAWVHAQQYALENLSNAPQELVERLYGNNYHLNHLYGEYRVDIYENGQLATTAGNEQLQARWTYVTSIRPSYPVVTSTSMTWEEVYGETEPEHAPGEEDPAAAKTDAADAALARVADQEVLYSEEFSTGYSYDSKTDRHYETVYSINYYNAPEYEVRVYLAETVTMGADYMLITALYPYRDQFIPVLLAALAVFAVSVVFLCTVAGRTKNGEVKLAAINRIPLDLYGISMAGLVVLLFMPLVWLFEAATYDGITGIWGNPSLCLLICCLSGLGMALCIIGFFYAFAAQVKASDNYWLRHTVCGWCLRQLGKVLGWIGKGVGIIGRGFRTAGRGIRAVFLMLPVIWQWIVTAAAMVLVPFFFGVIAAASYSYAQIFWILLCSGAVVADMLLVLYGGWCFGTLLKGIETMSKGDLNYKIDTRFLYGSFREFGEELNDLAQAAKLAAEQQMKSERMKTELITNVSHDIKTPLTSIINFVDLMKKPHSEAEGEEYLAVLDRQSQRLKKLIEDLMDMSKASSGTMAVDLSRIDAVEAVNQALGEFSDKLDRARLTPVFRHPETPVMMMADGKHLWRILSNVLNNAVKYALQDTRLYVDLMSLDGNAVIAIKNISREQLNVGADELMERFVRGDASRNTEGSGLGLHFAKSLVELQKGQMHLMVDGDLFKVTIVIPLA